MGFFSRFYCCCGFQTVNFIRLRVKYCFYIGKKIYLHSLFAIQLTWIIKIDDGLKVCIPMYKMGAYRARTGRVLGAYNTRTLKNGRVQGTSISKYENHSHGMGASFRSGHFHSPKAIKLHASGSVLSFVMLSFSTRGVPIHIFFI